MQAEGAPPDPEPSMVFGMHVTPYPKGVVASAMRINTEAPY
jgi:hypothetical protein